MTGAYPRRPLLSWDPLVLRIDLDAVQIVVNQQLTARNVALRDVRLGGADESLVLNGVLRLKGVPTRLLARLADLRIHRRFFGCRIEGLRGPLGLPLPLALLAAALDGLADGRVRFASDDGILTVDLRDRIPPGLDFAVVDVRCLGRQLIVSLAHGAWTPTTSDLLLPADSSDTGLDSE